MLASRLNSVMIGSCAAVIAFTLRDKGMEPITAYVAAPFVALVFYGIGYFVLPELIKKKGKPR